MKPKIADIQRAVCEWFGVTHDELLSDRRAARLALPRQIGMYLARDLTTNSLPVIGRLFGGRDHSTVIHAIAKVAALARVSDEIAADVEGIRGEVEKMTAWRDQLAISPIAMQAAMGEMA